MSPEFMFDAIRHRVTKEAIAKRVGRERFERCSRLIEQARERKERRNRTMTSFANENKVEHSYMQL